MKTAGRPPPRLPPRGCVDVRNLRHGLPREELGLPLITALASASCAVSSTGISRGFTTTFTDSAPVVLTIRAWRTPDLGCSDFTFPLTNSSSGNGRKGCCEL
ncbi:hypothetical protein MRX96_007099 [Rhipicephalus microplus]